MSKVRVFNPRRPMFCSLCGELLPGVIISKVGDVKFKLFLCGRCLSLALQEVTKQNWLSQWILWQANSKLGKEIQEEKRNNVSG